MKSVLFSCLELFDSYMVSKNLKVGQYKMEDASQDKSLQTIT